MTSRNPVRRPSRLAAPFLIALIMIALSGLTGTVIAGAPITGPIADNQLTGSDLGVAPSFVSDNTVIRTPGGDFTGPDGIDTYVASLQRDYPDAQFAVTDIQHVGRLIIVDWQGASEGNVVIPGRTLITVEGGRITELAFLNLNNASPTEGGQNQNAELAAGTGSQYVIVNESGNVFGPEP